MITEDVAQQIDQGLDRMFALLRSGDLADLNTVLSDLESALGSGGGARGALVTEAALIGLRRKAERNAACLKGAARGLRSARRRIAEVRAAASGHAAYDARGQRMDATAKGAGMTHRF